MCKLLATNVSTPLSENVQIRPKVSILCVATIFSQHCLNTLRHGVHQSFTGCHWRPLPLLHGDITELMDVRDLATFCLKMPHRLHLPSASLAKHWSSWRSVWGRYHVGILPCGPVSEGRGSCSALICHSTCWHSWFPQWTVAPQFQQCSTHVAPDNDTPTTMLDCRQDTLVFVLLTWLPTRTLDSIWTK